MNSPSSILPKERVNYNSFFETTSNSLPNKSQQKSSDLSISQLNSTSSLKNTEADLNSLEIPSKESSIKKEVGFMSSFEINSLIDSLISNRGNSSKSSKNASTNKNSQNSNRNSSNISDHQMMSQTKTKNSNQNSSTTSRKKQSLTPTSKTIIKRQKALQEKQSHEKALSECSTSSVSSIDQYSKEISDETIRNKIDLSFGNDPEMSKQKIEEIFHELGVLEGGDHINNHSVFRDILEDWKIEENKFDAIAAKKEFLLAIQGNVDTKFRTIVKYRISTKLVNKKDPKLPYVKEETYQGAHIMSSEVYKRINAPMPEYNFDEPEEKIEFTKNSKKVLLNSVYARGSFLRRGFTLEERRGERMQKIVDDNEKEFLDSIPKFQHYVFYTDEELDSFLEIMRYKKEDMKKEREPFPLITPYDEYEENKKIISRRHRREKHLPGWDDHFKRMEDAIKKKQMKTEEDEKYAFLPVPIIKRAESPPKTVSKERYLLDNPPQKPLSNDFEQTTPKRKIKEVPEPPPEPKKSKFARDTPPGIEVVYIRK
ncbi:hypothetical protein TRFO_14708 [Tritrichomonas foetus]|uniref:Uncharacterized protein n=1 Tax=Tritrichomonas foetus TaxID=1144522 RepID=A0A1J4KUG4_9EUKA|nr:hypothetical protein TRFO_14708 [Tritrichomonas foetus]|eukprot:OHT14911.1 hypothetical protein TRFO_14708 [Tritrichomonas foetus]